jgi:hypothetical protein
MGAVSTRKQIEDILIRKAWEDAGFRQRLKSDPKAAIAKEFGIQFSDDFKIHVVEESDEEVYLVLPARAAQREDSELADHELASVAGGRSGEKKPVQGTRTSDF